MIDNLIQKLPNDIMKKIFYDYLEIPIIYAEINNLISDSKDSTDEYYLLYIVKILNYILSNEKLTNYFYNYDYDFQHAYNYHIIKKKKKFNLLSNDESFALHWTFWI